MSDTETKQELTMEDRLKAIAYQFITLYERWSEDRQSAAKQGADTAELVKLFTEQVNSFKELEPKVRQHLAVSIQDATSNAAEKIGEVIGKEAIRTTDLIAQQLSQVVNRTENTLTQYEGEIIATQWKVIGITVVTTIATCLLLVWLLIPKPTLPLTSEQVKYLNSGIMLESVWPKLSKSEQQHLVALEDQAILAKQNSDK